MKIKILLIAALLALFSCKTNKDIKSDQVNSQTKSAMTADKPVKMGKTPDFDKVATLIEADDDIKTFDFERIFKEANQYFEAAKSWKKIKCVPKSAFICTKRECPQIKTIYKDAYLILDKKNDTIAVCRDKVCSYLNAKYDQTGVFVNAWVNAPTGMTVRVLGNSRYKQISMVGLDAYITNGECTPID